MRSYGLAGIVLLAAALAGCGHRERAPRRPAPAAITPSAVCGTNGTTYENATALPEGVVQVYEGPCRRCEESACGATETCVMIACPFREGPDLDTVCLERKGPRFCMPAQ